MKNRAFWIDNLRSFIILLVVAHHAALSYPSFAYFNKDAYMLSSHPIVDAHRCAGMDYFIYFNDIFLMSLMFFISGLFITSSLNKKGRRVFLRDRFNRLFVTFIIGATIFIPLALYPSYSVAHSDFNFKNFIIDFYTIERWPIGPPWFIWVLFLFNLVFVLIYKHFKKILDKLSSALLRIKDKPFSIFVVWFVLMWILYVPLRLLFGPYSWTVGFGPFDFQNCTLLFYFGYFLLGAVFGNISSENGIFTDTFIFLKKWKLWLIMCCLSFLILISIDSPSLGNPLKQFAEWTKIGRTSGDTIYDSFYVATCTFSCLAFLSMFKSLADYTNRFWDSIASNSFFIYLIHYIFIIWTQYAILQIDMSAIFKFVIVFLTTLSLSWSLGYFVHKNKKLSKYF
jgi:glucans biosynthesis protein C